MARNGAFSRWRRSEMSNVRLDDLSSSDSSPHEVHVLAVDDSLVDRKVIERLLKISSCKVTAVDSGRRALQFLGLDEERNSAGFDDLKVDLIITDYFMPGMTGYELLKKIKGSSTFREIPVVIMSSENVLPRINRCLEEGAEEFIVKPVKLSDVRRLKSHMFGESRIHEKREDRGGMNKRKSMETTDLSSLQSPPPPPPPSSLSSSPPSLQSYDVTSSSSPPSTSSPSSPRSFLLSSSPDSSTPCSPTSLDSPTRRLKMAICDQE